MPFQTHLGEIIFVVISWLQFLGRLLAFFRLYGAEMWGANLEGVHLVGAVLDGVIMPDGESYDPEVHTVEALTIGEKEGK